MLKIYYIQCTTFHLEKSLQCLAFLRNISNNFVENQDLNVFCCYISIQQLYISRKTVSRETRYSSIEDHLSCISQKRLKRFSES